MACGSVDAQGVSQARTPGLPGEPSSSGAWVSSPLHRDKDRPHVAQWSWGLWFLPGATSSERHLARSTLFRYSRFASLSPGVSVTCGPGQGGGALSPQGAGARRTPRQCSRRGPVCLQVPQLLHPVRGSGDGRGQGMEGHLGEEARDSAVRMGTLPRGKGEGTKTFSRVANMEKLGAF